MDSGNRIYEVFVKVDERQRIIAINSSAFLQDTDGWIKIDEGYGAKYLHAQMGYLPKPLLNEHFIPVFKLENGKVLERTEEEIAADMPEQGNDSPTLESRVKTLETENQQLKEALDLLLSGETEKEVSGDA